MQQSKLTVIVPTYNQASYLENTILSLICQSNCNLRIVVVNDGSTDETDAVIEKYKDRIIYHSQENVGQSKTLNHYWNIYSDSDYLAYLSSDDLVSSDCYSKLIGYLDSNPDSSAVYPDFHTIDAFEKIVYDHPNGDFKIREMFEELICYPGVGAIFRSSVISKYQFFWDENLKLIPDLKFWMNVSSIGIIERFPEFLAFYRTHSESTSFKKVPANYSNEYLRLPGSVCVPHGISKHNFISSCNFHCALSHIKSGRYYNGFYRIMISIIYNIFIFAKVHNVKLLIVSLRNSKRYGN